MPIAELRHIVTTPAPHTIFTNNNRVIYFVDLFIEGRTFPHNYLADSYEVDFCRVVETAEKRVAGN